MKNFGTKKRILQTSFVGLFFILFAGFYPDICPYENFCRDYISTVNFFAILSLPVLLVFPFSLITYKMSDEVFECWRNFSLWFLLIPYTLIFIFTTRGFSGGGVGGGAVQGFFDGIVALFVTVIYFVTSTVLVAKKRSEFKK